jgi:Tfp pilus assembly protein PilF
MSVILRPAACALGLTIVFASAAGAQAPKECEVNENRPSQIARATLAVQVASGAQSPDAATRQLTSAVKMLTDNGEKMENQVGRNFVLGKALVLWSMQPNVELMTKRGPLGYTTNPEGTIDLVAAIDSAFKVVETANPECITETSRWRGQKAWVNLVNKAIERLNAEDTDSAEWASQRAIILNPYGPYGYVVMANVLQKRKKATEAFALYRKSIEVAVRDTAYNDIKLQSLIYLGNLAADSAELAPDAAAKRPYVEVARFAFGQVVQDTSASDLAGSARQGLCRVAIATGDTASLRDAYKDPLVSPASFSYSDLMNAGVCMARAEMVPEATTLFQAAYEKNRYHRDVLSNLSIMLLRSDKYERSVPLAIQLVAVEPNNPENLQLLVLSYAGIAKRTRDARLGARPVPATKGATKTKTTAPARAPAAPKLSVAASDSLFRVEKAYTDSAVSLNEKKDKLAYKVTLSDFTTSDEKATVAGSVNNQGTAQKPITIQFEFLDKGGKVIATKDAVVGEVPAGGSKRFSVTVNPGTNIAAFRYAPIE